MIKDGVECVAALGQTEAGAWERHGLSWAYVDPIMCWVGNGFQPRASGIEDVIDERSQQAVDFFNTRRSVDVK